MLVLYIKNYSRLLENTTTICFFFSQKHATPGPKRGRGEGESFPGDLQRLVEGEESVVKDAALEGDGQRSEIVFGKEGFCGFVAKNLFP